ncbi:AroM family protein [Candidatus Enterococcus willemsii]|uniref:AroM family protein n=1 Tax=Candidatus Enterococcus willemsii TaxID=1857215 RepID=A0ABQ6YZD8_9ENTE|nr:AroM family protein [Enterococcus sp. CU12B]KAF1303616.1 hypothetical protein BAU17_06415 [Enterococcus sp. CU12B]
MNKIVFITIGEAPRRDIEDSFLAFFNDNSNVSQVGILDGLTVEEAFQQFQPEKQEEVLVSTFCNGQGIQMSKEKVQQRLQQKIISLEEQGVDVIVILCTAEFEKLVTKNAVLIEPEQVLLPYIHEKFFNQSLGVILPLSNQIESAREKWRAKGMNPVFEAASPYKFSKKQFMEVGQLLQSEGIEVIVLDCMGYSRSMREFLMTVTNLPVYQSNELLFEYVQTMFEE